MVLLGVVLHGAVHEQARGTRARVAAGSHEVVDVRAHPLAVDAQAVDGGAVCRAVPPTRRNRSVSVPSRPASGRSLALRSCGMPAGSNATSPEPR
jgi:hypothetical protein